MAGDRKAGQGGGIDGLVAVAQPRGAAAEAYRTLLANIRFSSVAKPLRVVLLTSPGANEGTSTTLVNLGVTAAHAGVEVVLVDCDLRRPALHHMFALPNAGGVTSALLEDQPDALSPRRTSVSRLRVVTSGPLPPNRAEILGSPRLDSVFGTLRESADLVLVDSPPISAAADASVLAPRVDGVVLVIDAKRTRPDLARRASSQLEHANARILGVALTNATVDSRVYRY